MKKRLLSLLLLAAMVIACVSGAAEDERRYVSGQWIYSLLPDGTAKLRSYNGFAMNVAGSAPNGLSERAVRAQETFLVGVQNGH